MRPPLSYVPLLPWTILVVAVIITLKFLGFYTPDTPALFKGKTAYVGIVADVTESDSGQKVTAEFKDSLNRPFLALLTIASFDRRIELGDSIIANVALSLPKRDDSYPDAFDYQKHLHDKGVSAIGYVPASSFSIKSKSTSLLIQVRRWQQHAVVLLKRSRLSEGSANFLATALLGDTASMPEDVRNVFSGAGQAHILALSGMHVGIITMTILVMLLPLTILRLRRARLTATVIILWAYAVFTGLSPSVVRAVIMATCISGGYILQRHHVSFNSLLMAAILILAVSPTQLFDIGFQMSFVSVACILLFMPAIQSRINRKNRIVYHLSTALSLTLCATLGCGIITAYYFHTFPLYFLPANLPLMIILPPLMGGGILLLILEHSGYDPSWLCLTIDSIYSLVYGYAEWICQLPNAIIRNIYPPQSIFIPYYASVLLLAVCLWIRKKWAWISLSATVSLLVIIPLAVTAESPESEYFIPRDYRNVSIVHYDGNEAILIALSSPLRAKDLLKKSNAKYKDFLGRRDLDSLSLFDYTATKPDIIRNYNRIKINETSYIFIDSDSLPETQSGHCVNYAVICNGFKGNILDIPDAVSPDTILLSANLNVRRHNRYEDSLQVHNIPYRSLRHSAHHVKYR